MIGIFDSGSGGLTILKAACAALPQEAFLYLGDHARAPYGARRNADIVAFTTEATAYLFDQGCRLVILACNTAAAVALRTIQMQWLPTVAPGNRVLGVLAPTVEALSGQPWHATAVDAAHPVQTVAVFATPKTVEAASYVEEIAKRAPNTRVVQVACPHLVEAIEDQAPPATVDQMVAEATTEMAARLNGAAVDAILLGCTHYPLVEDLFRRHLPHDAAIVSQPEIVAAALKDYVTRHPGFACGDRAAAGVCYLTTGHPARAAAIAAALLGLKADFVAVTLDAYSASPALAGTAVPSIARK